MSPNALRICAGRQYSNPPDYPSAIVSVGFTVLGDIIYRGNEEILDDHIQEALS